MIAILPGCFSHRGPVAPAIAVRSYAGRVISAISAEVAIAKAQIIVHVTMVLSLSPIAVVGVQTNVPVDFFRRESFNRSAINFLPVERLYLGHGLDGLGFVVVPT